ncbi:DUF1648 domain-containing protein [Arthrobacter gandavensis]|uniref:DUF1648 domain-containing protein n=1 Tax=Arthrobacter gandavensis TaxID=169960 RepID=UPI00188EEFF7|nr:DUF1648 domain-containing protein [Arthrobacter gandavensis]MBF4995530.1 DUF1648 domain-containing protein [Arthrobacter gandavensis]
MPHWIAALLVASFYVYGASAYGSLPDTVPTHWGLDGTPDSWESKSFGSVFLPLNVAAGMCVLLALVSAAAPAMTPRESQTSRWEGCLREGNTRGTIPAVGICSLALTGVIGALTVTGWRTPGSVAAWPVLTLLPLTLVAPMVSYAYEIRNARRSAAARDIHPTAEEAAEESLWFAGILYNDSSDPRVLVSKRRGNGMGITVNVGNRAGRAAVVIFLLLFTGLPLAAGLAAGL